jgi:hypothetical protein
MPHRYESLESTKLTTPNLFGIDGGVSGSSYVGNKDNCDTLNKRTGDSAAKKVLARGWREDDRDIIDV